MKNPSPNYLPPLPLHRACARFLSGRLFLPALLFLVIPGWTESVSETPRGDQFERLGPFGGDVRALLIHPLNPTSVYLGTADGHIYKSENTGARWRLLSPGIGVRQHVVDTLVPHPEDSGRVFAGAWDLRSSGGGLFETRDSGATWKEIRLPETDPAVRDFAICKSSPASMIAGTLHGVHVSDDGGVSWRTAGSDLQGLRNVESVAIDPHNPRVLYAGTWRLAYRSLDGGKSWRLLGRGMLLDSHVFSLAVDPRDPSTILASACTGVYRSGDRGAIWQRLRILPSRLAVRARTVYLDPTNPDRVYAGTTEGLHISGDRGSTWKQSGSSLLTINAVQVDPFDSRKILIGTDDRGVLRSDDAGATWKDSSEGFVFRRISGLHRAGAGSRELLAGLSADGREGGLYSLGSARRTWSPLTREISALSSEVHAYLTPANPGGRLVGTSSGIFRQQPGGSRWLKLGGSIATRAVYSLIQDGRGTILAGTNDGIYRAEKDSLEFVKIPGSEISPKILDLVLSGASSPTLYAGTSSGIYRSPNQGRTWEWISSGLPAPVFVESLAACPSEPDHLVAGTSAGLFETRNGGATWEKASEGGLGVDVPSVVFLDSGGSRIAAADGTFGGIFLSEDGGHSWIRIEDRAYASPVRKLLRDLDDSSILYLGTKTEGVYRLRLGKK